MSYTIRRVGEHPPNHLAYCRVHCAQHAINGYAIDGVWLAAANPSRGRQPGVHARAAVCAPDGPPLGTSDLVWR